MEASGLVAQSLRISSGAVGTTAQVDILSDEALQARPDPPHNPPALARKCFVDYAGTKPRIIDSTTAEVIEVELFVAGLGAPAL